MQLTGAYEPDVPLHYFPNKHTRNAEAAPVGLVSGPVELEKLSCSVDRREVMWLRLSESCCRHRSTCSGPVPLGVNVDARYLLKLVWTPALELRFFLLPRPLDSRRCSGDVNEHSKTGGKNVIQGQNDWGVTYNSTQIYGIKGSTVDITCTYTYPSRINGRSTTVQTTSWFTKWKDNAPVDLRTDPDYTGRVEYYCPDNVCTLRIRDVRQRDSAVYKFRFITNQPGGRYTGEPGVTLSVTDLQVQVITSRFSSWADVMCGSCLSDRLSYIWYKNGQKIQRRSTSSYADYFSSADSISCAVKGHEKFPSPSVCVFGQSCNRVIYTDRSLWTVKGSSVNISCTYNGYNHVTSKFWFSPERSHQWQNLSQPEDLSKDSQYSGRVQVFETETGRSTLRITDLRETDSAQYHFKFITQSFEWRSSLPGTTLTVTVLQVQVIRSTVHQFYTEAELKCLSSKSPTGRLTFVWFNNGQKINKMETASYKGQFNPGDHISCALKEHEDCPSPPVYAPKLPSVSVSPSAEIVEGSSVTLTCSSDANPAANYTWYKKNGNPDLQLISRQQLVFSSILSSDAGQYYCTAENKLGRNRSEYKFVNVEYPPQLPSLSVSPSAEIVEGSSVNLTCSSDANPAANYTWYKENENSPKASGQILTITDFRPEHSGNYYCEAQNTRGRQFNIFHLKSVPANIRLTLLVSLLILLFVLSLFTSWYCWIQLRIKKKLSSNTEPNRSTEMKESDSGLDYENISAFRSVTAAQTDDTEEQSDSYNIYANISEVNRCSTD